MNRKYRQKGRSTDVLAFRTILDAHTCKDSALGQIFLSPQNLFRRGSRYESDALINHRFKLLLIHGMMHLLGHDHQNDIDFEKMKKLERRILFLYNSSQVSKPRYIVKLLNRNHLLRYTQGSSLTKQ